MSDQIKLCEHYEDLYLVTRFKLEKKLYRSEEEKLKLEDDLLYAEEMYALSNDHIVFEVLKPIMGNNAPPY